MSEIENEAKQKAQENGTDVDKEKEQLINEILKDAGPVVDRMKELAGKMNGMVERIGESPNHPIQYFLSAVQDGV